MANNKGTATIDFGAFPGSNQATVTVTGQTSIAATSYVDAFIMADDSASGHTASDHRYLPLFAGFTCGTPTASTGFVIYGTSPHKLQGQFTLRWVWTD